MAPYHILIVIISSVIPENLVLLTKSEQSGPKSAHIRPTTAEKQLFHIWACTEPWTCPFNPFKGFIHVQIEKRKNLSSYVHVLHKTSHWEVSRRSRAVDVKEMY